MTDEHGRMTTMRLAFDEFLIRVEAYFLTCLLDVALHTHTHCFGTLGFIKLALHSIRRMLQIIVITAVKSFSFFLSLKLIIFHLAQHKSSLLSTLFRHGNG